MAKDGKSVPKWLLAYSVVAVGGEIYSIWLMRRRAPDVPMRWQDGRGPDGTDSAAWPFVSIIVPSRNEERNLPRLLPSLLNQDYPRTRYEVIVVDDQSTDRTPEILREFADSHLRVINGEKLPAGWKGKPWAMQQGAGVAQGDWLLFTDADTVHHPAMLTSTIAAALREKADLFTIGPYVEAVNPAERLMLPLVMMGIYFLYPPSAVNDPKSKTAIANGQFVMVKRTVYDAVGGIDAVHNDIAEDLEFGRLIKRSGYRLYLGDGRELLRVRMYHNMAEVWEGWRKNVLLSFKKQPRDGVQSFAMLAGGLLPFVSLFIYGSRLLRGKANAADKQALAVILAPVAGLIALKRRVDRRFDLPFGWALTFPIGLLVFALILLDSFRLLITGQGVSWKGRRYTE